VLVLFQAPVYNAVLGRNPYNVTTENWMAVLLLTRVKLVPLLTSKEMLK